MCVFSIFGVVLVPAFQAASAGLYPIDMSFPTTPEVIYTQLAQYSEASRRIYRWFFVVDLVWPPLLASLFSLLWCWLVTFMFIGLRVFRGGKGEKVPDSFTGK